ncbi:hypothetical protein A2W14_00760 [Candidatus Gottesmanbacteria bacterium RBG_16_37_8]|uniref:SUF system FeS cluster assembly SufBD core domain-containing protein n=1 Tax=Candidatus Gottesmanbacteria bacterium RBG_16_37_8 TaxID=1798371 RepID=A0A1F5YUW0_9BACT|nr:MAG: hypothetical protein A2W14_00760 [Candidatus Gottesmanbacteria bacterium RBG_16_37_8]
MAEKTDNIILIDKLSKNQKFDVHDRENKIFIIFLTGKKDHQGQVSIIIKGKSAKVQILGLIIGSKNQKLNLFTLQDHQQKESISDLLIKSVLFDNAKFYYEGLIKIAPLAQKSNAYQKNQNLLMSANAWADSRPKLEILANDVRCTHGATVGKIDPEILYYLKTRGLSDKSASMLVIDGFFRVVLDRIPDKQLAEKLQQKLNQKIRMLL